MARRSEQGNVLGFVLVGALLLGLLAGGMYVIKSYNPSEDKVAQTTKTDDKKNAAEEKKSATSDSKNDDKLKAALDAQAKNEQAEKKKTQDKQPTKDVSAESTQSEPTKDTAISTEAVKLPETGVGDAIAPIVGATLLVGSTVSYARSRRLI